MSLALGRDELSAALPGDHHGEGGDRDGEREPRAVDELGQVRGEEKQVEASSGTAAIASSQRGVRQVRKAT